MKKRFLSLFMALVMALSMVVTTPVVWAADKTKEDTHQKSLGYIPFESSGGKAITDGLVAQPNSDSTDLPTYYNSKDLGYITPVRNQNPWGSCWAHAALGSVEAYMIKHGITDVETGRPATTDIDLSEYQLVSFTYNDAYDAMGMLEGDSSRHVTEDGEGYVQYIMDAGGNDYEAAYTLMRWEGTASESVSALSYKELQDDAHYPDPQYWPDYVLPVDYPELDSQYAYLFDVVHLTGVEMIPLYNRDAVKRAIMEYGAGSFSYMFNEKYDIFVEETRTYKGVYYCPENVPTNHAVTVVGWDDNYAVSNFNPEHQPENPGAWIIKNSWGTWYGDEGYGYISYEDVPSRSDPDGVVFYAAEEANDYDHLYQYDGTGCMESFPYSTSSISLANVFTAAGDQTLEAVAVATKDEAISYTLEIYTGVTGTDDPTSGTLAATQQGSINWPGYHQVKLNAPVTLAAGEKYSVVFHLTSPTDTIHIPVDESVDQSDWGWPNFVHTTHPNTSYMSYGYGWYDESENYSYRIKAYTKDIAAVVTPLEIVRQPVDFEGVMGATATFAVAANGDGLTYQWQVNSGSGWKNSGASGNKTEVLKAGAITEARLGYLYRCIITDQYGNSVTSNEVRMILVTPLKITAQPQDFYGIMGATATFTVVAEGDGLKYQWQVNNGSGWANSGAAGNKTAKLKAGVITEARLGYLYRCIITDSHGSTVTTDEVRMILNNPLEIVRQPMDFEGVMAATATFAVAANGDGLTYQWQVNSGSGWKNSTASGNKTAKLKAGAITEARLGYLYRCIITDQYDNSVTSNEVRMILVTPLKITAQPQDFYGIMGATATFTVVAEGDGLKYQWQVNNGSGWANSGAAGNKTAKLKAGVITEARLGYLYRCIITDSHGSTVTTDEVRMILNNPLEIVRQPVDFEGVMGATATFAVAANGDGLKYQWQVNSGSGWKNSTASGNKTAKLKAGAITEARLGYLYRCIITDQYGNSVTSNEVRMILVTPLKITAQPQDFYGIMGATATFTVVAEGDGLKYQWQVNNGSGWANSGSNGNKTATLKVGITEARLTYRYRCIVTDEHGNSVTTNEVKMVKAASAGANAILAGCIFALNTAR